MSKRPLKAALVLEDGSVFPGEGFGHPKRVVGEVVFTTGMVGYPESLTDPSFRGQILCFTYPLIGNYGVPSPELRDRYGLPLHYESDKIQVLGVIVHELCEFPSHWSSWVSLDRWLYSEGIPGISRIDTRKLTKKLRIKGVMMGALEVSYDEIDVEELMREVQRAPKYDFIDFAREVTVKEPLTIGDGKETVVVIDAGVKYGILRELLSAGVRIVRVPYDASPETIIEYKPQGILVSNGPGNPALYRRTIETVRAIIESGVPTVGICLGNQIIALALGGTTYKLKFGHRGQNKPCIDVERDLCLVTSQNHGFAVDEDSAKDVGFKIWFINADDGTVEGIRHEELPVMAVQFHPEASPGPYDARYLFDIFLGTMRGGRVA